MGPAKCGAWPSWTCCTTRIFAGGRLSKTATSSGCIVGTSFARTFDETARCLAPAFACSPALSCRSRRTGTEQFRFVQSEHQPILRSGRAAEDPPLYAQRRRAGVSRVPRRRPREVHGEPARAALVRARGGLPRQRADRRTHLAGEVSRLEGQPLGAYPRLLPPPVFLRRAPFAASEAELDPAPQPHRQRGGICADSDSEPVPTGLALAPACARHVHLRRERPGRAQARRGPLSAGGD